MWPREEEEDRLPALANGDLLDLKSLDPKQHFTQPPPRFSEATLIKELEERGIGRPSTYVPILSTIQDRGYVEQQERRFVPTWLGETVNDLMVKHFGEIVDVNFTAAMEHRLDDVEEGSTAWTAFLKDFYDRLMATLKMAERDMERVQKPSEDLDELCPQCGAHLKIRMSRFGRFISCSRYPECTYKRSFVEKTGALCPQCGGDLVVRKSKGRGKIFYGCSNYPTCNFATWNRPVPLPCPECGGLLTQANGAKAAVCQKCGAEVEGIVEGNPVVVGHRLVGAEAPKRATRARKTAGGATTAASLAPRSRGTVARKAASKTTGHARKTTAANGAKPVRRRRTIASIVGGDHAGE